MFDCLIIGSGPSGMTAAIYCKRNNLNVAIIEGSAPGGQMVNTAKIENYPGFDSIDGVSLAMKMYEQVLHLQVEYIYGSVNQIKQVTEGFELRVGNDFYQTKTVIVATGAKNKRLNIPGEERFINHGISWCAICDGTFYKNKPVAVIGGGNSSLEEAIYLSSLASKVYILHRRNQFRAEDSLVEKVKSISNIELIPNVKILEFKGNEHLEAIDVQNNSTKEIINLKVDGCFEYVGMMPSSELFKEFMIVDESGYIEVDRNCETKVKGLFACGDVVAKSVRQIATAISDGAVAALNASKYCK